MSTHIWGVALQVNQFHATYARVQRSKLTKCYWPTQLLVSEPALNLITKYDSHLLICSGPWIVVACAYTSTFCQPDLAFTSKKVSFGTPFKLTEKQAVAHQFWVMHAVCLHECCTRYWISSHPWIVVTSHNICNTDQIVVMAITRGNRVCTWPTNVTTVMQYC